MISESNIGSQLLIIGNSATSAGLRTHSLLESEHQSFCVSTADNIDNALTLAATKRFDVALLDITTPRGIGTSEVHHLAASAPDLSIVVITDRDDEATGLACIDVGAHDYIYVDELTPEKVSRTLRRTISQSREAQTNRRRVEAELIESRASLNRIIRSNPDSMVVVNDSGTVLFANPAAADMFARPIDMLLDHQFGVPVVGSGVAEVHFNGNRTAEMRVVEISWMDKPAWLTSLRDITERKQLEADLRDAKIVAEHASKAKTQFLACMSHELRTPLNSVIGFSELIQHDWKPGCRKTCFEYSGLIQTSGHHLLSIVNDILDVTSFEAGGAALCCSIFDLNDAITKSLNIVSKQAWESGVKVTYQVQPVMVPIYADFRRIKQMIINIVRNGIKYTPRGGTVTVSFRFKTDNSLAITIADTGIGIGPEFIDHLQGPFARIDDPYKNHKEGAGLGLYITRSLVELHGGKMHIESNLGQGTCVVICLPPERVVACN